MLAYQEEFEEEKPPFELELSPSQQKFYFCDKKFQGFIAGYGSGKTLIGTLKLLDVAFQYPKVMQGYFAPTFPLIRDIFYPTVQELCEAMELKVDINKTDKIIYIENAAPIICRTMTNPEDIVGFQIGDALVDEFDVLRIDQATIAWRKILSRIRKKYPDGRINRIYVTTTPEGYKATYNIFVKGKTNNHALFHGSTYENRKNLPEGYIESMEESYPPELIKAYLNGQFVNLTYGLVYKNFDRHLNNCDTLPAEHEELHVGMDFNVMRGASSVWVMRNQQPHMVDEIFNAFDTDQQITILKERYPKNPITVYPDATGSHRTSANTTETDLAKLKLAGYYVVSDYANPAIKERVYSLNAMFLNGKNERRAKVNTDKCPNAVECLEQQVYDDNGQPDKAAGKDHMPDAMGYFMHKRFPITNQRTEQIGIIGLT